MSKMFHGKGKQIKQLSINIIFRHNETKTQNNFLGLANFPYLFLNLFCGFYSLGCSLKLVFLKVLSCTPVPLFSTLLA